MDALTDTNDTTAPLADVTRIANTQPEPLPEGVSLKSGIEALQAVSSAHKAELQSTIDAAQKNNDVVKALQTTSDKTNEEAISAFDNLNKIARWPGSVSHLLGLFDPSFNATVQKNNLDISQLKLKQSAAKAQSQIEINNADPAIAHLRSELATQDFNFQKDAFSLAGTVKGLTQKDTELRLSATRLLLEMDAGTREKTNFALNSMTDAQKKQALKEAKAGKGAWADKGGLLEHSINVEEQAEAAHGLALVNLAKGKIELADQNTTTMLSKIPNYILAAKIEDARANGDLFVDFNGLKVPTTKVEAGFVENKKLEDSTVAALAAESGQQIAEKLTVVGTAATAMAGLDPEAARIYSTISQAAAAYKPGDYNSARQFSAILDDAKTRQVAIAKRVASTASTPEAKAAIEAFATTGQFDAAGGAAVVKGIAGNYMAQTRTKYASAYAILNNAIANEVARQGISGAPTFDGSKTAAAQTQQMMAFIAQSKDQKKIGEIKDEVMANPAVQKQMADQMAGTIQISSLKLVFDDLAKTPQAATFWGELRDHPEQMNDPSGAFSLQKLGNYLATKSVPLGPNAPDYGMLLAQAMRTRALKSRSDPTQDPTKVMVDHALDAQIFGGSAEPVVLADFAQRLLINAQAAQAEMKKRIEQDMKTSNVPKAPPLGAPEPVTPQDFQELLLQQNAGASATGAPLTVGQMKLLYGGPQPVTTGVGR